MLPLKKNYNISSTDVSELFKTYYASLMPIFYESQSSFLCSVYKRYNSIEAANVILCFARNVHLEIIRQREKDLNFNISIENFWNNFSEINKPSEKIASIVKITGIPKETVRRKIKSLMDIGFLSKDKKNNGYYWSLLSKDKNKDEYFKIINYDTKNLARFISKFAYNFNLNFDIKIIEKEIKSQFSFYWYHYLSCQLEWLKMWQLKFKDNELLLISLQATIPTLQSFDKNLGRINIDDASKIIGTANNQEQNCSVSTTSVSEVTSIPRATCARKLNKLVNLGFLIRVDKNKRYAINQVAEMRTKNILKKENVSSTIKTFSEYIAIILNSLIHNKL